MKRAHQLLLALFIFILAAVAALGQTPPQEPTPDDVVRIDANLVTIPAQVMDRDGRFVTNLQKEDFQIFEDGVEQDLSFFAAVEEPFTILILLDVSGSMYTYLGELVRAGNAFLSQLRPNDNFIAVSFCDQVQVLADLSRVNSKGIRVMKLRPCGRTTLLYEAVKTALKRMKTIPGRKAILLFSDGFSEEKHATAKGTLREAEEQEALIYSVQFGAFTLPPLDSVNNKRFTKAIEKANEYMTGIAQKTGGRHYRVEDIADLEKTFASVAEELRRQYSLGFYPKVPVTKGERRQIRVTVRRPNLAVRARDSYLAAPSQQGKP